MRHLLLGLMLGCVAGASVGCTTCCTPYDYCAPTNTGPRGEMCDTSRQSSILEYGSYEGEYDVEYGPSEIISETIMPAAPADVPHESNARRSKLRPIPDRTTSRVPVSTMRR